MAVRQFRSRFSGECQNCRQSVDVGHDIHWNTKARGKVWHHDCADVWGFNRMSPVPSTKEDKAQAILKIKAEMADKAAQAARYGRRHTNGASPVVSEPNPPLSDNPPYVPGNVVSEPVASPVASDNSDLGRAIAAAVAPYVSAGKATIDKAQVEAIVEAKLAAFTMPDRPLTVEIRPLADAPVITISNAHKQFPELLAVAQTRQPIYLRGKAGGGKSTAAHQVATALSLPFYMISLNVQTAEYKLFGSIDAHNSYRGTGFREAFENGGIMLIDEIDNASGNLLTSLNTALANGHYAFPDKVIARHPDFICIATGNTAGRGGNRHHAERRALDSATLDRFVSIQWDYDWVMIRNQAKATASGAHVTNGNVDRWVDWVIAVNAACEKNHPNVLVTPRAALLGSNLLSATVEAPKLADWVAFKGHDTDTVKAIVDRVPYPSLKTVEA